MKLEVLPVTGIGDVTPGTDLAALIAEAAPWLRDGDVLVVTSKIVSKSEGQLVDVPIDEPSRAAVREEILAAQTARTVAQRGQTRIVQTHHGFVMASAGIDASNVDRSRVVLLPKDPDASARSLRAALRDRYDVDVAVVVSDTMGRPWRNGLTDVALGAAGIAPIRDHRGETDPYGNELHITQMAVVDELAAAGELVKGKCDQVPVAVVRGYLTATVDDGPGAVALIRDAASDLFSLGTAEARAAGLRAAATLPATPSPMIGAVNSPGRMHRRAQAPRSDSDRSSLTSSERLEGRLDHGEEPAAVERAIASVAGVVGSATRFTYVPGEGVHAALAGNTDPAALIRLGEDIQRLRTALAAESAPVQVIPLINGNHP